MRFLVPLGVFFAAALAVRASVLSDLSAADREKIQKGAQVMTTEKLDGYPWPRVRVYQLVKATPREVMAVFTDYNNASNFVPNCLKSEIVKRISPRESEIDYIVDVPMLADEAYTVRDALSPAPGGGYSVKWKVIKATSIEESEGNILAEPHGDGECLIRYTNLVKPSSIAAPLLKGIAMSQMKDTVRAIVERVEKVKATPGAMKPELDRLDAALGAK